MTRGALGAIAFVLFLLACAIAWIEGSWWAWAVVGFGGGWYWGRVELAATAEIRRRDGTVSRRDWGAGR